MRIRQLCILAFLLPCLAVAQDHSGEKTRASKKATAQIHMAVDQYVSSLAAPADVDSSKLAEHLSGLLELRHYDPEYSGSVFANRKEIRGKPVLVIGYRLVPDGAAVNESAALLRAYTVNAGRFQLTDTTGQDLDGYGLFVRELKSPMPGEMWILAWGQLGGFNGKRARMRVYAFDGAKFRTVWAPSDILDGRITVNETGFSVEQLDEERYYRVQKPPYHLNVDYILVPDGPRAASTQTIP